MHAEADRLEHVISEELEARIDQALGFPTHDPHGDPIPDANLEWPAARCKPANSGTRPDTIAGMALKDLFSFLFQARHRSSGWRST